MSELFTSGLRGGAAASIRQPTGAIEAVFEGLLRLGIFLLCVNRCQSRAAADA